MIKIEVHDFLGMRMSYKIIAISVIFLIAGCTEKPPEQVKFDASYKAMNDRSDKMKDSIERFSESAPSSSPPTSGK